MSWPGAAIALEAAAKSNEAKACTATPSTKSVSSHIAVHP